MEDLHYYQMDKEKLLTYLKDNTNALDKFVIDDIKNIETDMNDDVYILLKDGNLYKNGEYILSDIDRLWFLDCYDIFVITKFNSVFSLMNNNKVLNDYIGNREYKKVLTTPTELVALTTEGDIKYMCSLASEFGIIPDNFKGVEDILARGDLETIYIIKNGEEKTLFLTDNV